MGRQTAVQVPKSTAKKGWGAQQTGGVKKTSMGGATRQTQVPTPQAKTRPRPVRLPRNPQENLGGTESFSGPPPSPRKARDRPRIPKENKKALPLPTTQWWGKKSKHGWKRRGPGENGGGGDKQKKFCLGYNFNCRPRHGVLGKQWAGDEPKKKRRESYHGQSNRVLGRRSTKKGGGGGGGKNKEKGNDWSGRITYSDWWRKYQKKGRKRGNAIGSRQRKQEVGFWGVGWWVQPQFFQGDAKPKRKKRFCRCEKQDTWENLKKTPGETTWRGHALKDGLHEKRAAEGQCKKRWNTNGFKKT